MIFLITIFKCTENLAFSLAFLSSCGGGDSSSSSDNKIGGCVLTNARALPGSSLRAVSSVSTTDGSATYDPFTKILTSYGTTMLSIASVSDSFVSDIGTTIQRMFDSSDDTNTDDKILLKIPISMQYPFVSLILIISILKIARIIIVFNTISAGQESRNAQVLEIMEHILIMTNIGFHTYLMSGD